MLTYLFVSERFSKLVGAISFVSPRVFLPFPKIWWMINFVGEIPMGLSLDDNVVNLPGLILSFI